MSTAAAVQAEAVPEHELKSITPAIRAEVITQWLRGRCAPDPEYPDGLIASLYFDDQARSMLQAKVNSDYLKRKVRIRWYRDPATGATLEPAFAEIKSKVGARRFKERVALELPAAQIAAMSSAAALSGLLEALRALGHVVPAGIQPIVRVTFRRRRFVDPHTGARVAIDSEIRGASANPAMLRSGRTVRLPHAVIEIKGGERSPSAWMAPLRALGCRPAAFSKYERCVRQLGANGW